MRITKKFLREQKNVMETRILQVLDMDDRSILEEFSRCFPNAILGLNANEKRKNLVIAAIDRAFPFHILA